MLIVLNIIRIQGLENQAKDICITRRIDTGGSRDLLCFGMVHNLANFTLGEDGRFCNYSSRSNGDRVTGEVVASEVLINRNDDIHIAFHRSGDLIGVHISSGKERTVTIPIPFPGLFITGGVGVRGQQNRIGRANLRCSELRDRGRGDSEVVNRGEGAFATATGNLHGKLMGERVIGQAGEVGGNETVRLAGCARNVVAVVFPLIIDGDVTAVLNHGGECHHIVLAGVSGSDNIGSHIGRHSEDHRVGLIQVINLAVQVVRTGRVARNPKGWSHGIRAVTVEVPPIGDGVCAIQTGHRGTVHNLIAGNIESHALGCRR